MDNCDLEKLSVCTGKLDPPFQPLITNYKVNVPSNVSKITLDLLTSDSGASYKILGGDGSKVIQLKDGMNIIDIEVIAEDGTTKKYTIQVTKLSASTAELHGLQIPGHAQLQPEFAPDVFEYTCTVAFCITAVTVQPKVPDSNMQVSVQDADACVAVQLMVGETLVEVQVSSADGTKSQLYTVVITREQIPHIVTFNDLKDQIEFECAISLTAFYRPVSINGSDPKHIFSAPYIDVLTRRSKVDPLDERPLGEGWKTPEYEVERRMSAALVKCCFSFQGCETVVKFSDLGEHAIHCPHKQEPELDAKEVTDSQWYKTDFASSDSPEIQTKHTLEARNWERRLHKALGDNDVDKLCRQADEHIQLYKQRLPKAGDLTQYEGVSPLDALHHVAVDYASGISLNSRDPRLHFCLGLALEEHYYATEIYGLKKKAKEETQDLSHAKAAGREEEILAICRLHGLQGQPSLENQLKALDAEFQQLKEQGQSSRADYIQTLFIWLSKQAGKSGRAMVSDEESPLHRAFLKYLDAWSLNPEHWEYNLYVGRHLLLQGKCREALQHLQKALALQPCRASTRFYTGLALLQQDGGPGPREQEAVMYLQQGLEHVLAQHFTTAGGSPEREHLEAAIPLSVTNAQFLRGCLSLGEWLRKAPGPGKSMSAEQVLHIVADAAARSVCGRPSRGAVGQQLEWVLLEAHYSLLEDLVAQPRGREHWIAKRCQGLTALIRLTSIPACRELLDMQEKVCQLGVRATPCSSHALYLLGAAQLAQYDNNPDSKDSPRVLGEARLSFRASIDLEDMPDSGPPPTQLASQKWWQDQVEREKEKGKATEPSLNVTAPAGRGTARGRGAAARQRAAMPAKAPGARPGGTPSPRAVPTAQPSAATAPAARGRAGAATPTKSTGPNSSPSKTSKTQVIPRKSDKADCCQTPIKPATSEDLPEHKATSAVNIPVSVNRRSHTPRLGLARALSRTEDTQGQACQLYEEVITMAPEASTGFPENLHNIRQTSGRTPLYFGNHHLYFSHL
ncbi:uncharacterized protein LOC136718819 [Amia ocellicauda]|uniref:uncharacterized protein LOC136718819 n=1 Tax=Amia ocellicauda TaxID=2972642 RepID=UPI0034638F4B